MSCLEAYLGIYRLLMKEIFNAYLLTKRSLFELVMRFNTRDYNGKFSPGQASKLQVREDTPLQELPPFRGF
jgi:hypothetical protein